MGTGNRVSLLYLGEAVDHGLYDRLLQCVAAAQAQRRTAAKCGRAGLLENSKDGGLKHLTTTDLGYTGAPFPFDPVRRHQLKCELDAYYAKLYGLTRDELRYILDPADVMGEDYPSETFRVLKNKEIREFGEYRTQRLVLEAWDKLEAGELQ